MSDQKQPEPRIVEGKGGELRLEWGENPPSALARIKILANNVRGIAGDAFTYGYSSTTVGLFMGELLKLAEEVALELFKLAPLNLGDAAGAVYTIEVGGTFKIHVRIPQQFDLGKQEEVCRAIEACFHVKVEGKPSLPEGLKAVPAWDPAEKERWAYKFITPLTKEEREQVIRDCAAPLAIPTGEFIDSKELAQLKADLAEARAEMVKQSESAKELRERLKVAEARVKTDAGLKRLFEAKIEKLRATKLRLEAEATELKAKANRPELFSAYLSKDNSFLVVDAATMEATAYRLDANGSLFIEKPATFEACEFEDVPEFFGSDIEAECVHCGSKAIVAPGGKIPPCYCPGSRERRRAKMVREAKSDGLLVRPTRNLETVRVVREPLEGDVPS